MKTEILEEFVVVAKHLSFSAAAKELFTNQPTLSAHISSLEKELGFDLFVRNSRHFYLTQEGSVFLRCVQKTLASLNEGIEKSRGIASGPPPVLVNSLSPDSPAHLALIRVKKPHFVFVDIPENISVLQALEKNIIDVGSHFDYTDIPKVREYAKSLGISFISTGFDKMSIHLMKSHPLAGKPQLSREDLRGLKVTITSGVHYDSWQLLVNRILGEDLDLRFSLNQPRSVNNLIFMDLGNSAHICSSPVVNAYFAMRDDIATFHTVDGKELSYPDGFVYKETNLRARDLILALREKMEQCLPPQHSHAARISLI